ncbi:hypothetical protein LINGRAPRIM_LOCUS1218 [Linum grandiflorum]
MFLVEPKPLSLLPSSAMGKNSSSLLQMLYTSVVLPNSLK